MDQHLSCEPRQGMTEDQWIPTLCYECMAGTCLIRVHVVNETVVNLEGNLEGEGFDKMTSNVGRVCPKSFGVIQKLYNPYRIKTPLKRTNPEKGKGIDPKWVEISWDEALTTVAEKLRQVLNENPRKLLWVGSGREPSINGTYECFHQAISSKGLPSSSRTKLLSGRTPPSTKHGPE